MAENKHNEAPTGEIKDGNAFEKFPSLAASILLLAHKAKGLTMMEWTIHCEEINKVCELVTRTPKPTGEIKLLDKLIEFFETSQDLIIMGVSLKDTLKMCKEKLSVQVIAEKPTGNAAELIERIDAVIENIDKCNVTLLQNCKAQLQQAQKMREALELILINEYFGNDTDLKKVNELLILIREITKQALNNEG